VASCSTPTRDWMEVAELLTKSYCLLAPTKLVKQVNQPAG
jgi:hypothetical protein